MTYYHFIILNCAYVATILLGAAASKFVALPPHVAAAKPNRIELLKQKSKAYLGVFEFVHVVVLAAVMVGIVGMFFLWKPSPWIFAGSSASRLLFYPTFTWHVRSGLEDRLAQLETLVEGAIITVVFFGPARHLFFPP